MGSNPTVPDVSNIVTVLDDVIVPGGNSRNAKTMDGRNCCQGDAHVSVASLYNGHG